MTDASKPDGSRILTLLIEKEMKESYLNYAMSVICARALPDVRDGLKPSQRRILVAMNDLKLGPRSAHRKCAKICGDTSGNYHPHGESVVYPTLVRMGQPFNMRYPLVDAQGNFGAISGDPPAAMRYTEARMSQPALDLLEDLDKDTVDVQDNYDGKIKDEPTVLPGKFPNLLCNGSQGIAVGMATSLPPHNLTEVARAIEALLDNPEITDREILEIVPGPDFPCGGVILGRAGILEAYRTGRGQIQLRGTYHTEELKGRKLVVFTQIPYTLTTEGVMEKIEELVKDGRIDTISDVNDESNDRVGLRIVIELKRGIEDETVTVNQLFQFSPLQSTFSIINLAIDKKRPRTFSFKGLLVAYRDHRINVIRRRTRYLLRKAEERLHILEGLRIAVQNIDEVVEIIKTSPNPDAAQGRLMERFALSELQARAILDMRLARLTGLEIEKLEEEWQDIQKKIEYYKLILRDMNVVTGLIKEDLKAMVEAYGDKRRTVISDEEVSDVNLEDLIEEETMAVTVTHEGYIKRTPLDAYRRQGRGGKGVTVAETKEGDFLKHIFVASTHAYLLFFSDRGRVYWKKVFELPELARAAKGRAFVNLLEMQADGEKITSILPVDTFDSNRYVVMTTRLGYIKKTPLVDYSRPKRGGIIAVILEEGDSLKGVELCKEGDQILLGTADGYAIRFDQSDARPMGRAARGVRGISVRDGDRVVDMVVVTGKESILTVCENGYGKRTELEEYRLQNRGGMGVINIRTTERNGKVVNLLAVNDGEELMMITQKGMSVRTAVAGISVIGRATQGVRLISLEEGDLLVACAKVAQEDATPTTPPTPQAPPPTSAGPGPNEEPKE
jgi:DNA gyrase subunit A